MDFDDEFSTDLAGEEGRWGGRANETDIAA
jgi:hypothetical protein